MTRSLILATCCLFAGASILVPMCRVFSAESKSASADFYVSRQGNDQWSGRLAQPNLSSTDGPFATIERARDAVRSIKETPGKETLTVQIRGGTYSLKEPIVFSINDSARPHGRISYAAYPNEKPIITSDIQLSNWKKLNEQPTDLPESARGKIWVTELPDGIERLLTLYEGEQRLPRARGPGFAPVSSSTWKPSATQFVYPENELKPWHDLRDAEILVIPTADYEMCILPLAGIDAEQRIATTTVPATRPIGPVKFVPKSLWVENVLAVLDEPGEWVVHHAARKIYYWPKGDQPSPNIVAPRLTELVRVEGRINQEESTDQTVQGLTFDGLTFCHAERYATHGLTGWSLQHHWEMFDRPAPCSVFEVLKTASFRTAGLSPAAEVQFDLI